MPDKPISMERIARDAVRVRFDPGSNQGTAMFLIDLAREASGTVDEVDRGKVLLKAMSVAEKFIECVNTEIHTQRRKGEKRSSNG